MPFSFFCRLRRQRPDLVQESKSVWNTPMFNKFPIRKSTDVHDVYCHRIARARVETGCLAPRPNRIIR